MGANLWRRRLLLTDEHLFRRRIISPEPSRTSRDTFFSGRKSEIDFCVRARNPSRDSPRNRTVPGLLQSDGHSNKARTGTRNKRARTAPLRWLFLFPVRLRQTAVQDLKKSRIRDARGHNSG